MLKWFRKKADEREMQDLRNRDRVVQLFLNQRNKVNLTVDDVRARTGLPHKDVERLMEDMVQVGTLSSFTYVTPPRSRKYWLTHY